MTFKTEKNGDNIAEVTLLTIMTKKLKQLNFQQNNNGVKFSFLINLSDSPDLYYQLFCLN